MIKQSFLSLLFPPLCLSCEEPMHSPDHLFCDLCSSLLELIDPTLRCPRCFSLDYSPLKRKCARCSHIRHPFSGIAAAFEYTGPAAALVKKMKYGGLSYLAKTFAACLITQLDQLNWPSPDIIVPVPSSLDRKFQRGFNQSALLAREVALLLNISFQEPLTKPMGNYSQAGLRIQQRKQLNNTQFFLKKKTRIQDKIILVIDDVTTTGKTLEQCGNALLEGCPGKLYGLTVCKTPF